MSTSLTPQPDTSWQRRIPGFRILERSVFSLRSSTRAKVFDANIADYPELTLTDIQACLVYAASRESHEVRLAVA